jgi:hypothetical protein
MFENSVTFGHHASLWQHGHPMALRMVACSNAFTCSMVAQTCSNTLESMSEVYKSNETNENFIIFWPGHHTLNTVSLKLTHHAQMPIAGA